MPTMFLFVDSFEAALTLARQIAAAHRAGDVTAFVGRWKRECDEIAQRAEKGEER
jgi:hypothetical protein